MKRDEVIKLMLELAGDPASEMYYRSPRGLLRRTGAAHREAFWRGYEGVRKKYVRGSWCAWAYSAGKRFKTIAPEWVPVDSTQPTK